MRITNYLLMLFSAFLFACSSAEETLTQDQKKEPDIYLFTEQNKSDTTSAEISKVEEALPDSQKAKSNASVKLNELSVTQSKKYLIQVGAFSTEERAQAFVKENQSKIAYLLNISLRNSDNYYVVRLHPFGKREDAESVKDNIRQIASFKDAFIVNPE